MAASSDSTEIFDFAVCTPTATTRYPLDVNNIDGLAVDFQYDLIPDCPAATAAGYTATDRAKAQTWYSPSVSGDYFYYTAWTGGILGASHKSSILVCRNRYTGALIYAVNCHDFSLDTAPNFLGDSSIICRAKIAILGSTLYLCNAVMSNIGPQLYAVNKSTGALKWACAYYPPAASANQYVTQVGDYSAYLGSNMRSSDLCSVAGIFNINGVPHQYVFVGVSSLQNAINAGQIYTGRASFTDQGFLFCIEDLGTASTLVWKVPTSAPLLQVGDVITSGGDPNFDPFRPGQTQVVIDTVTSVNNYFVQPYFIPSPPAPAAAGTTPVAASVSFDQTSVIDANLVQPIWSLLGVTIFVDGDRATGYTLSQLLTKWTTEQSGLAAGKTASHNIWAYVTPAVITAATSQSGNNNLIYFKYLTSGQSVIAEDAQSLNYWGNSVWGAPVSVDTNKNLVYFGTGQAHQMPLDESMYYNDPSRSFLSLKKNVIDTIDQYAAGLTTLSTVNNAKAFFTSLIAQDALNTTVRSPRGCMSYSDAVMAANIVTGKLAFAVRTVSWDSYTFLSTPSLSVYPINAIDGDVSSGVNSFVTISAQKLVTAAKSGLTPIINITNYNSTVVFTHNNLAATGVVLEKLVFSGPNGALGGSNYLCDDSNTKIISSQGNMSWFSGSVGSTGNLERHVNSCSGQITEINNSFMQAVDTNSDTVLWETPYGSRAHAQIKIYNGLVFAQDSNGSLYVMSASNGAILWKMDGHALGLSGGIVAPEVTNDGQVLWANNYSAFGVIGSPGPSGVSLRVNTSYIINNCTAAGDILPGHTFTSWDVYPRLVDPNPSVAPVVNEIVIHVWKKSGSSIVLTATHQLLSPASTQTMTYSLGSFDNSTGTIKVISATSTSSPRRISYVNIIMLNTRTCKLTYNETINGSVKVNTVWLKLTV